MSLATPLFGGDSSVMTENSDKSPLRVAQILGSFGGGGAQRLAYNLAVALGKHVSASFAVAALDAGHYASTPQDGVTLVALNARSGGVLGLIRAAAKLRRLIVSNKIDIVHVHGTGSLPFVVAATLGLRRKVGVAFTWQDSEKVLQDSGWRQRILVWAIRKCDHVSGSSRNVAARLEQGAGIRNVGVFHGGVPMTPGPPERQHKNTGIIWLGRVVPPKDPQILVRAAASLRAKRRAFVVRLIGKPIASTKWYFEETRELISSQHLSEEVHAMGFVPDAEMAALLESAEIGVQTSHTEGLSIALMEQMMAGLAIVATDVGDTSCAIQHEHNGLLIPAKDDAALTGALDRLLTDDQLRRRLGTAARESAIARYSLDAMARRALSDYRQVASSKQ